VGVYPEFLKIMKIKNHSALAISRLRKLAMLIAEAGFKAIDTTETVKKAVRVKDDYIYIGGEIYPFSEINRIFVAAVGKCALEAGAALEKILGERLDGGIVIDVKAGGYFGKLKYFKGTHPLSSEDNVKATKELINFLNDKDERDLVIFVISGGGSALLSYPEGSSHEEEVKIFKSLTKAGATIQELNTVRKHMSLARGGFLAKYAYPARSMSLIFSDVPGDDINFIASGPTVKDKTTIDDAAAFLAKYDILDKCDFESCGLIETPKEEKFFKNAKNSIVVSNSIALDAMELKAAALGFKVKVSGPLKGEAKKMGKKIADELHKAGSKFAIFYGGETTVTLGGEGRGGRNLEVALSALRYVKEGELILPLASDGRDNGEFAGAICDIITKEAIEKSGLNIEKLLEENNSYPLFEKVGHYVLTGDTGSNVSDLAIALKS